MAERGGLLAVFAHPDDEVLGPGGTMAMYANHGIHVSLVCATRGESGEIAPGVDVSPETLAHVREQELSTACAILGISEYVLFDYRDSGMAGTTENKDPRSLVMAPVADVSALITAEIQRLEPRVVVTWGSEGGYGHPDHVKIHEATLLAFDQYSARSSGYRPEKLYAMATPRGLVQRRLAEIARHGAIWPTAAETERRAIPDEHITAIIETGPYAELKMQARQAHRSQLPPTSPFAVLPAESWHGLFTHEYFIRLRPEPDSGRIETDLFASD